MSKIKINLVRGMLALLIVIFSTCAYAYIDPGTSGMIIGGGIWPFILIVIAAISGFLAKFFFRPIKNFFLMLKRRIKGKK